MKKLPKEPLCSGVRERLFKILRFAMRTAFILIFSVQLLIANHEGKGQNNLDSTFVNIEVQNENLKTLFKKIEKQTSLRFAFFEEATRNRVVNLPKEERSVSDILDIVLGPSLTYVQVKDNYIVIKEKKDEHATTVPSANKEFNKVESIPYEPVFIVSGTVTEATTKTPLPGVNIIVKGTTRGTTTDVDGRFAIDANDQDVLVFTFIGYKSYETQVNGRNVINVTMEVDMQTLKEVEINAGYWKVTDRERTGNISRVTAEEIQRQPISNPLAALQGRMPGVYIQQSTGVPGGNFEVQIRGRNSLRTNGNDPLYIIDGVPFTSTLPQGAAPDMLNRLSPLNSINPNDIESIEVLKDADATAIYGSRGANGVILITTKKGKPGKTKYELDSHTGIGKVTQKMDLLSTNQYLEMRKEAFKNDERTPNENTAYDLLLWDTTRYTDWQKELIGGTAKTSNIQASLSGGNQNTQFLIRGSLYRETTVFPGDFRYKKGTAHFNLNHASEDKKLRVNLSSSYVNDASDLFGLDLTRNALTLPPIAPALYDEKGDLNWENSTWGNPLVYTKTSFQKNTENLITNLVLDYEVIPGLHLKTSAGYTRFIIDQIFKNPIAANNPAWGVMSGNSTFMDTNIKTWIIEPQALYNRKLGRSELNVQVGTTFQESISETQTIGAGGFTSDALQENLQAASFMFAQSAHTQYKYNALFARINYNFNSRYIINLTGRRDGSSRFGPSKQFANFGAIGVAWIFNNEKFMENVLPFLSLGKFRASYGTTGSDQIGDYAFMSTYTPTLPYSGTSGLTSTRLVNQDFAWEENRKFEAAIELGFMKGKIFLSASWYQNKSSNQLVGLSLPSITGFTSIQDNLPATVQNTGWEFQLSSINISSGDLSWSTGINLSIPRNKLLAYPNLESSPYANIYVLGEPLSIQKRFHYTGLDAQTGVYTFQDVDGNEQISYPDDLQSFKKIDQRYFGGFQNTLRFKRIELDFLFQFVKQSKTNFRATFGMPGTVSNQPTEVMNRWQEPGDHSSFQRFSRSFDSPAYLSTSNLSYSDLIISDASFIRLKNISLLYSIPLKWVQKIHMENFKIFLRCQNVVTITNYQGLDPETGSISLPPLRVATIGLQLSF